MTFPTKRTTILTGHTGTPPFLIPFQSLRLSPMNQTH